jgi:hypothetical protein
MSSSNATPQLKITCQSKQCSKIGAETMDVGELFEIRGFRKLASPFPRALIAPAHSHHPMISTNAAHQLKITCHSKQCSAIDADTIDAIPVRRGRGQANWRIRDSRTEATLHCNFRVPFALNSLCSRHGEEILCAVRSRASYSIDPLCHRFLVRPISWGEVFFVGCAHENRRDAVAVRYDRALIKIMQMTRGRSVVLGFILGEPRKVLRLVGTNPGPKILRGCSAAP